MTGTQQVTAFSGTPSVFNFDQHTVRIVMRDGEPWFVGKDVALTLGYADPTNAMKRHCRGVAFRHPIADSLGRKQEARILGEPDVLRLIVNSNLPAAERFEKWVFEEVLPSIRKTGAYTPAIRAVPPAPTFPSSMELACATAIKVHESVLHASLKGEMDDPRGRWLLAFNHRGEPYVSPVPSDAYVLSHSSMLKMLVSSEAAPVTSEELAEFIAGASRMLARRAELQKRALAGQ